VHVVQAQVVRSTLLDHRVGRQLRLAWLLLARLLLAGLLLLGATKQAAKQATTTAACCCAGYSAPARLASRACDGALLQLLQLQLLMVVMFLKLH
jgi:hypothetical protein